LTWVFGPYYHDLIPGFTREGERHVGGEWRVSALVGGYLRTVHPDRRAVVNSAEVEQETLVARRRVLEGAGVPDDIVEGRLPDAGEVRLVAVGDDYLPVERGGLPERRSSGVTLCQPLARPTSESSNAKLHSPFRFVQSRRRSCGRGYSGRGVGIKVRSPFC
jgi:hypothetical protein